MYAKHENANMNIVQGGGLRTQRRTLPYEYIREEFQFMAKLMGPVTAVYRVADGLRITPRTVRRAVQWSLPAVEKKLV